MMPRLLEVPIAGCLLVLLLPVATIAALLLIVDLGSPLTFRQVRVGRGSRLVVLHKLRTMRDKRNRFGRFLPDEDRLTALGRVLRRYRVDEIPQLVAVLRGDIALVGPRPLLPETIESFGDAGRLRCEVKPGITGWAQVNGNTRLANPEKLSLDLWYAAHRSTTLDLLILWRTALTLLRGETRSEAHIRDARLWCSACHRHVFAATDLADRARAG